MLKDKSLYWVLGFSLLIFWSRTLPFVSGYTPVLGLCLLAGYCGRGHLASLLLPALALFASDWVLGFYPGWTLNYLGLIALVVAGQFMSTQFRSVVRFGILSPFLFFVVSNLGVWLYSGMYAINWDGLVKCYNLALPFARVNFVSTMVCLMVFSATHCAWQRMSQKGALERF